MRRLFQLSNIPAYVYIVISAWMTSSLFHLFLDDFDALLAFVIYYILVLFVFDEAIVMFLYKIRYNISSQDLLRVQPLLTKAVKNAMISGYQVPQSYRVAYINDLSIKHIMCFGKNNIAVSRYVLDHFSDDELVAMLMHEIGRIHYGLPFLDHYLLMCNIYIVIASVLYFIITGMVTLFIKGFNRVGGQCASLFFVGTGLFAFYTIQFLKIVTMRLNLKKCDQFVVHLGMKQALLDAMNHLYKQTGDDYYNKRYLYIMTL